MIEGMTVFACVLVAIGVGFWVGYCIGDLGLWRRVTTNKEPTNPRPARPPEGQDIMELPTSPSAEDLFVQGMESYAKELGPAITSGEAEDIITEFRHQFAQRMLDNEINRIQRGAK